MKKQDPLARLIRAAGTYKLNQKSVKFQDRRTKRNRDRSTQKRRAVDDSAD